MDSWPASVGAWWAHDGIEDARIIHERMLGHDMTACGMIMGQSQHVMSLGRNMVAASNHMLEFRRATDWLAFRNGNLPCYCRLQEGLYQSDPRCCQTKPDV